MKQLSDEYKAKIEKYLMHDILLMVEVNLIEEGWSKEDKALKRKMAATDVSKLIIEFAKDNGVEISDIKDYVLEFLDACVKNDKMYMEEYKQAIEAVTYEDVR